MEDKAAEIMSVKVTEMQQRRRQTKKCESITVVPMEPFAQDANAWLEPCICILSNVNVVMDV